MLRAHHLVHIMVATVEKFQAKERPIIIVSTTRSQMGGIGFLRDPKVSYYIYIYMEYNNVSTVFRLSISPYSA